MIRSVMSVLVCAVLFASQNAGADKPKSGLPALPKVGELLSVESLTPELFLTEQDVYHVLVEREFFTAFERLQIDPDAWRFAMRRRAEGGSKLMKAWAEILKDFADRL